MSEFEVVATDHGKQFGYRHWFTFSCPKCTKAVRGRQIKCNNCGCELKWKEASNDE